ncbi:hypothetical protein BDA96_01G216900 [Sorghum bicolor]|uniref:Uncharacterized protein n=1 Tax=Sorghum bicolor TaxID=4558 RepID=A0A921S0H0_SORBI|nr:hypothetical protein BDA96_01G216900 [Sorghum bicolor]
MKRKNRLKTTSNTCSTQLSLTMCRCATHTKASILETNNTDMDRSVRIMNIAFFFFSFTFS